MSVSTVLKRARSLRKNGRHLAILFKGGRIIEYAYNQTGKTKAVCAGFGYTRERPHAEFAVILKFIRTKPKKELRNLSMLVLRWGATGRLAWSFPCAVCKEVVSWFGVRRLYALNHFLDLIPFHAGSSIQTLSRSEVLECFREPKEKV
jgi:tRNA(Arg) A34 adenosine deaminase TadA